MQQYSITPPSNETLSEQPKSGTTGRWIGLLLVAACTALASGCGNPIVDDEIELLGEEDPDVGTTEFHRPGQPCVLCHGDSEGAEPKMALAGTIFADSETKLPVGGAEVTMVDAVGQRKTAKTNCTGNFWLTPDDWDPQFPVAAEIRYPTYDVNGEPVVDAEGKPVFGFQSMATWISRDRSCAKCHTLEGRSSKSTGWIYCNAPGEVNPVPFPQLSPDCGGKAPP